jgi:tetratricopeptide (TPR) repeat protein
MLERRRGNWKRAVDWQNKCISASGKRTPEALVLLGEFFLRSGDPADAANTYAEALTLDPYNPDARRVLGEIFRRARQWDQARVQLEVVVRYYPNSDPGAYASLADVYRNMGRSGDAESTIRKGDRIFAGQPPVVNSAKAN